MEVPYYVLKANEGITVHKDPSVNPVKVVVVGIIAVSIFGSIFFKDSLLSEIPWKVRIALIFLCLRICSSGKRWVPSPMEIWFYNDYFVLYKEKHYYDRKLSRKEYYKIYYKDIEKFEYKILSKRMTIYSTMEITWYDYNKDGSLPAQPTYHRKVEDTICFFYTNMDPNVDFLAEIEKHSPIRIVVENS